MATKIMKWHRAHKKAEKLWVEACNFDGIDPKSPFVVLSNGNPIAPRLDRARILRDMRLQALGVNPNAWNGLSF